MNLLVSKTLVVCLLALAVRSVMTKYHNNHGHDHHDQQDSQDTTQTQVNQTCVQYLKSLFDEDVKEVIQTVDKVKISKEARLYKNWNGKVEVDHGEDHGDDDHGHDPDPDPNLRFSSETGNAELRVEKDDEGSTTMFLMVRNSTLNCTVKLHTHHLHGNLILHPVFFTISFSPDGKYLVYMAEANKDTTNSWSPYVTNKGGLDWSYKVFRPTLFLVNVDTQEVSPITMPPGTVPGQSMWTYDSQSVVTVARWDRWTPCPECTDEASWLLKINVLTPDDDDWLQLTSSTDHVSVPRSIPGTDHILFFKNHIHQDFNGSHVPNSINAPQSLVNFCLKHNSGSALVDENKKIETYEHIYPDRVSPWPHRMFLQDGSKIVFNCDISEVIYVVDLKTKELFVVKATSGIVLDVLDDEILMLHRSVEHGQELRRGRLIEGDMAELTTPTTTTSTTTTTTTTMGTTTTTTPDPCLEVVENEKKKLREEFLYNLTQFNIQLDALTTTESSPHLHHHEADEETTTSDQSGLPSMTTTHAPMTRDTTMELVTTMLPLVEEEKLTLREVEMIRGTVLSYNPYKDVTSETVSHTSDMGHAFTTVLHSSEACKQNRKLVVNIGNICGHSLSVNTVLTWVKSGFCVLECRVRSAPGSQFSREALDCDSGVTQRINTMSPAPTHIILSGSRFGGTVAAQMALINSGRYQHLILWDPELSLVSNVVTHSNTIARSFLTSSPLTPDDINRVWRSSALSSTDIFRSNILTISGSDKYLRFILPIEVLKGQLRQGSLVHYHSHNSALVRRIALSWSNELTSTFQTDCNVPDNTRPTKPNNSGTTPNGNHGSDNVNVIPNASASHKRQIFYFLIMSVLFMSL